VKIAKITAKTRHQLMGVKTITQSIKQHLALTTIVIIMQCKVFICKILSSQSHIEPASNKAHGLW